MRCDSGARATSDALASSRRHGAGRPARGTWSCGKRGDDNRYRQAGGHQGLRALGSRLRSGVRRGIRAGPARGDRRQRARRRDAFSKSASARASRCPTTPATAASSASTSPSRCCARRASASPTGSLRNVERLAVMDAERLDFPDASFDVVVAQYVVNTVPASGGGARRVRPRAQAGRRDRDPQPRGRGRRGAARARALVPAASPTGSAGAPSFPGNASPTGPRARRTACA